MGIARVGVTLSADHRRNDFLRRLRGCNWLDDRPAAGGKPDGRHASSEPADPVGQNLPRNSNAIYHFDFDREGLYPKRGRVLCAHLAGGHWHAVSIQLRRYPHDLLLSRITQPLVL